MQSAVVPEGGRMLSHQVAVLVALAALAAVSSDVAPGKRFICVIPCTPVFQGCRALRRTAPAELVLL